MGKLDSGLVQVLRKGPRDSQTPSILGGVDGTSQSVYRVMASEARGYLTALIKSIPVAYGGYPVLDGQPLLSTTKYIATHPWYFLRTLFISPNVNAMESKVPTLADLMAYPPIIIAKNEKDLMIELLERRFKLTCALTGDRYGRITENYRTTTDIYHLGNLASRLDFDKKQAQVKSSNVSNRSKVFFELALINAGFKIVPYSEPTKPKTKNRHYQNSKP